ncbi:MAG: hypothetical protein ACM3VZ_15520 [Acidobacteriota bacterium]
MIITVSVALGLATTLYGLSRLVSSRQAQSRKQAYQRFLQEDRQHSTLEYHRDVTRQRRDTRMWR